MDAQGCLKKLRELKDVAFATVDAKGNPQVRIIDVMLVEEGRLYFCTARGKAFYRELLAAGRVAVTGLTPEYQSIRLRGRVEKLADARNWIDRIFAENPVMKDVYPGQSRYILEPFCIREGELEWFDLSRTPILREHFTLGEKNPAAESFGCQGFRITGDCASCAACAEVCPQQCIASGHPYRILQEHCLHCGLCAETCPVKAIINKEG